MAALWVLHRRGQDEDAGLGVEPASEGNMFRLFENIIDPYPKEAMAGPPANARAFIGWFI